MITNFFKIVLPEHEIGIQRVEYSEKVLDELRTKHNHEASFFRNGDFIYASPAKNSALSIGERVPVEAAESPEIIGSLIRHLVFRTFRDAFPDRVPETFAPLRFFSQKIEHDPIRKLLPEDLRGELGFPRVIEVHVRSVSQAGATRFGLVIYSRHRWRFDASASALHHAGFSIVGSTVVETIPIPGLEGVLAPDENVLGQVEEVEGDSVLVKTNAGTVSRKISELHLQRTREQIGCYLSFRLGEKEATGIFSRLRESDAERANPNLFFGEVHKVAEWFAGQTYVNDDGFTFKVTADSEFPQQGFRLSQTKLVFDYGPGASSPWPLQGLSTFGPFDSSRFDRKNLRVLAIFHQRNRGAATAFLGQLTDGIPESKYFQKGLRDLFRLHHVEHILKPLAAHFPEDYETVIDAAVQEAGGKSYDLAIVECPDESISFPAGENPYLRAKARLMSYGIPVQGVRETHLRDSARALSYTLGPAALQIYAKVGGTPWLLPSSQSVDREIIVGIGNTIQRPNLWADTEQSRVVGLTTFFLGDGRYLLGQELRSVPYADYFKALLQSLEDSLREVSEEYGWKDCETVRLVFHVFKPVKNVEVEVVDSLIKKFPRFKILYAFVTVSTKHPWMMFRAARKSDGKWQLTLSERGDNLILDGRSCLVQLRGPKDRPNKAHRPPYPVLIRLHEMSTYGDLQYIAQQIHDFAFLSWRSFFPNDTPVTVFYSQLMASLSAKLQRVKGWNPVFLDQHFRRKKWFL